MARLYLVRRSMESYIGPLDISQLKQAYRRMEFGLQDEVAASCGEWIAFDDVSALKRRYPELAKVVAEELLGGWGISEHSQKRIIESTNRRRRKTNKRRKQNRPNMVLPLLVLAVALVAVAIFLARNSKFSSKFFDKPGLPGPDIVKVHLQNQDYEAFSRSIERLLPSLLPKVTTSRRAYNEWIPYIRLYAFNREGSIVGVSPKLMRGVRQYSAPNDCSVDAWTARWRELDRDKLIALNSGRRTPEEVWERLLVWDPDWIARRYENGWIDPINYYAGCLKMAAKAIPIVNQSLPVENQVPDVVIARLQFLLAAIDGKRAGNRVETGVLGYMTCVQNSASKLILQKCALPEVKLSDDWQAYLDLVRVRVETKHFLQNKKVLTDDGVATLTKLHEQHQPKDSYTSFSYRPEIKYLTQIMLNNGSVAEAITRMKYEFPEVKLSQ